MSDNLLDNLSFDEQTPSWRWDYVRALTSDGRKPNRTTDKIVTQAWRFLRRWTRGSASGRMQLKQEYPHLYAAYAVCANPQSERWLLEAGLLSQASFEAIGTFTGLDPIVIELYGQLFYDIREKRSARGYIANRILMPAAQRGMDGRDYDFFLKTISYFAGWDIMTQFVGDGELDENTQQYLSNNFVARMTKLGYIATHRLEVNNYNAVEVIEQCIKLRELEHSNKGPLSQNETWSMMEGLLRKCATAVETGPTDRMEDGNILETITCEAHEPRVLENTSVEKILAYGDPIPIDAGPAVQLPGSGISR